VQLRTRSFPGTGGVQGKHIMSWSNVQFLEINPPMQLSGFVQFERTESNVFSGPEPHGTDINVLPSVGCEQGLHRHSSALMSISSHAFAHVLKQ
jgi:hypothetical protein